MDRLDGSSLYNLLGQLKHPTHFSSRRINLKDNGSHLWIVHSLLHLRTQVLIALEYRRIRRESSRPMSPHPKDVDQRNAILNTISCWFASNRLRSISQRVEI